MGAKTLQSFRERPPDRRPCEAVYSGKSTTARIKWLTDQWLSSLTRNMRLTAYSMDGFENSGADFMPQYKPYLFDGETIITSPHKVYGPEQNDLVLHRLNVTPIRS